jgi:hypothetical protein
MTAKKKKEKKKTKMKRLKNKIKQLNFLAYIFYGFSVVRGSLNKTRKSVNGESGGVSRGGKRKYRKRGKRSENISPGSRPQSLLIIVKLRPIIFVFSHPQILYFIYLFFLN